MQASKSRGQAKDVITSHGLDNDLHLSTCAPHFKALCCLGTEKWGVHRLKAPHSPLVFALRAQDCTQKYYDILPEFLPGFFHQASNQNLSNGHG